MKKIISLLSLMMLVTMAMSAQVKLEFRGYKKTKFTKGNWQAWPSKMNSSMKDFGFNPYVNVKKIDSEIFNIDLYMGTNEKFNYNVVYDPAQTSSTRKRLNNNNITVYRPTGQSGFIVWTQHATLADLHSSPSKWISSSQSPNFYMWFNAVEGEDAYMYSYQVPSEVKRVKLNVSFKDVNTPIKGSYKDFPSQFKTAPANSYIEVSVIKEWTNYNMKFYENGKLVKDYNVTFDKKDGKWSNFKIDGLSNGYIYISNLGLRGLIENPSLWSTKSDAVIWIYDESKTGNRTRVK